MRFIPLILLLIIIASCGPTKSTTDILCTKRGDDPACKPFCKDDHTAVLLTCASDMHCTTLREMDCRKTVAGHIANAYCSSESPAGCRYP